MTSTALSVIPTKPQFKIEHARMARKPSPKPKHVAHTKKGQKHEAKTGKPSRGYIAHQSIAELDAKRAAFESATAPYVLELPERAKRPVGAPSLYDPEFCDQVIHYATLGHTIGATAGLLGVTRSCLLEWAHSHPEFGSALARAKELRQAFYESHLIDIARRGGDSTRMSAIKLGLLNTGGEDWKERLTSEHNVTLSFSDLLLQSVKQIDGPKPVVIDGEAISTDDDATPK